jgi:hypothetical protein
MKDFEHPIPDSIHPPRPPSQPTRRGGASLAAIGIEPQEGASDRNMAGIFAFIRAARNNPHILWGRDNSEIIYPEIPVVPRPNIRGGSSSESSSVPSSSSSEPSSSESSSEPSSSEPSSDSGSDKSTAIVPMPWHPTGYGALFTVESNEVLFEFVAWRIPILARTTIIPIDPRWLHVCEPDELQVTSIVSALPVPIGAEVVGGTLVIRVSPWIRRRPKAVTVKLTGIRKGFLGWDMPARSREQFEANEAFLNSAYPASPSPADTRP